MIPTDNVAGQSWRPGDMSRAITADRDVAAWSFGLPQMLGAVVRILTAGLGPACYAAANRYTMPWWGWLLLLPLLPLGTNRLEPLPAGGQTWRWKGRPPWYRWYRWHVRNWCEDLRKSHLGFGAARRATNKRITKHLSIHWADFGKVRVPFPYYRHDNVAGALQVMIGWKTRGILSFTVRRSG